MEDNTNQNPVQTTPQTIPEEPVQPIQPTIPPVETPVQPVTPQPVEQPVMQEVPKPKSKLLPILITFLIVGLISILGYWVYNKYFVSQEQTTAEVTPTPVAIIDPTANWKTYKNSTYGFQIKYPNNWFSKSCDKLASTTIYLFPTGPDECDLITEADSVPINLSLSANTKSGENLINSFSNMEEFNIQKVELPLNNNTRYLKYSLTKVLPAPGPDLTLIYIVSLKNGSLIITNYNTQYESISDQILSTFEFTDQTNENESLNTAVKEALVNKLEIEPSTNYGVSDANTKIIGDWAFGIITIEASKDVNNSGPSAYDFIARKINNNWQIEFAYTEAFKELLKISPDGLVDPYRKNLLLQ